MEINIFIRNFKLTTKLKEKHEINERFKMIQLHTDKKKRRRKKKEWEQEQEQEIASRA